MKLILLVIATLIPSMLSAEVLEIGNEEFDALN
jgi:hypothetical protein